MSGLVLDDLRNHARTFLFQHSLETLFFFYFLGDTEPSENLILEDWFKNDPVNQIGILEKQINELLCDEKSVKSSGAEGEPGSGPESDPDSQQQEAYRNCNQWIRWNLLSQRSRQKLIERLPRKQL